MRDVEEDLSFWSEVKFEIEAGALDYLDQSDRARINDQLQGRLHSAFPTRDFRIASAPSIEDCSWLHPPEWLRDRSHC